jgi:nucleoside-triphosphatase
VGKTTIIKRLSEAMEDRAGGFYTEEIRGSSGRREGFRLVTLEGDRVVMAHVDLRGEGRPSVSRYGVDVDAIEQLGVAALQRAIALEQVVVIDEIGKMELFCDAFRETVASAVDGRSPVLATAMSSSHPWVDGLKARQRVEVWQVTVRNRDEIRQRAQQWLRR